MIKLYEEILLQILNKKPYNKNGKTFQKKEVQELLSYLTKQERYEECILVNNFLLKRFDHETNYLVR